MHNADRRKKKKKCLYYWDVHSPKWLFQICSSEKNSNDGVTVYFISPLVALDSNFTEQSLVFVQLVKGLFSFLKSGVNLVLKWDLCVYTS